MVIMLNMFVILSRAANYFCGKVVFVGDIDGLAVIEGRRRAGGTPVFRAETLKLRALRYT